MKRIITAILTTTALFCIETGASDAKASTVKTVAIMELSADSPKDRELSVSLTEMIYEIASQLKVDRYIVFAREHVRTVLAQKGIDTISCTQPCHVNAGLSIGADFVFGGTLRRSEDSLKVVVELVEIAPGRLLGMKSIAVENEKKLKEEFASAIDQLVQKLSAYETIAPEPSVQVDVAKPEPAGPAKTAVGKVRVGFKSNPRGIVVRVDGKKVCEATPCSADISIGEHEIAMKAEYYQTRSEDVQIKGESQINWTLTPCKYNYFGMNDLEDYGRLFTFGFLPTDSDYRAFTVISGSDFANLNSVLDLGFGGDIFSYHRTSKGSHWGIFSFGPALRAGRIIVESHLHLLSFRHKRSEPGVPTGWLPGISSRVSIPLINNREWSGWAALVPVPAAGIDVWFDNDLNHDQTDFWIGFSWLTGFDFSHTTSFSFVKTDK